MASLVEVKEELDQLNYTMHKIFEEAGQELDFSKVKCLGAGMSEGDVLAELHKIQFAASEKGAERDRLELAKARLTESEREYQRGIAPVNSAPLLVDGAQNMASFNLMKALNENPEFKVLRDRKIGQATMEIPLLDFRALVTVSNMTPLADRQPIQPGRTVETRTVIDLIGTSQTDGNTLDYYEETTVINSALTIAEGTAKPEGTAGWTLRTVPVIKVAVWIPVTTEALDDVPFLESQIRGRLADDVARKEEQQVLTGTGTAGPPPQIRGLNNAVGIQTQAKGTDPTPDAIFRAMQKVRGASGSGFVEPDGVVLHPNDWTDIKLLRTANGEYIWGQPSQEGPDRIWGLLVRQTTAQTENTGLVGAFAQGAEVFRRKGITVTASSEHASNFIENKVTLLAESRLALAIWIPTAFCTVTGI